MAVVTQDFGKWLVTVSSAGEKELEGHISDIESNLEILYALLKKARSSGHDGTVARSAAADDAPTVDELLKRMSPERLRIMRAVAKRPKGEALIPEVAKALNVDRENVASNMQRMVTAGLLERVGPGRYKLTGGAAELLAKIEGGEVEI
jgi:predicted transcriptional regulator